jgi:hypothetical protein
LLSVNATCDEVAVITEAGVVTEAQPREVGAL